jgi:hypothetical protein
MTPEEIQTLGEKVTKGEATPEEKLTFLKELNKLTEELRNDIVVAKNK